METLNQKLLSLYKIYPVSLELDYGKNYVNIGYDDSIIFDNEEKELTFGLKDNDDYLDEVIK